MSGESTLDSLRVGYRPGYPRRRRFEHATGAGATGLLTFNLFIIPGADIPPSPQRDGPLSANLMGQLMLGIVLGMVIVSPRPAWAQKEEPGRNAPVSPPPLVSHDDLEKRLSDPHLRLLDARGKAEYESGHIPGAVWVDVKAAEKLAARSGGLKDREAWEAWAAPLGIEPDSLVLVYDGKRQLDAARTWWLLRYLGLERVGLIDGHFVLWQRGGRAVSTEIPAIKPRPLKVSFQTVRLATRDEVLRALSQGGSRIVDARSEAEYTGKENRAKRAGHIPGACRLEWSGLVDNEGRFLSQDELRTRLEGQAIRPGEPVITHCQSGGRASVNTFALERLGVPTRNYYAGWSDWGNQEETPVEKKE